MTTERPLAAPHPLRASGAFRSLWLAGLLSTVGSNASRVALLLYLFRTRDSALDLAALLLLDCLPGAAIAPWAGVIVDRYDKRTVMVVADLARMVLVGSLVFVPTLPAFLVVTALHSLASAFFQPAKLAAIPALVSEAELARANAADQAANNLVLIVGPVLGAELFARVGLLPTLLLDALSFLASALLIVALPLTRVAAGSSGDERLGEQIRAGWDYLRANGRVLHLCLLFFVSLVCVSLWTPLAPFFIRDRLGGSERAFGWQFAVFGAGAVAGALWAPRPVARFGSGVTLFVGLVGEALSLTVYAMVQDLATSMAILFFWGTLVSLIVVPFYSLIQVVVDERFRGRVFAVVKQSENVAVVLAMLAVPLLQGRLGSHLILFLAGAVYLTFAVLSTLSPGGRRLLSAR